MTLLTNIYNFFTTWINISNISKKQDELKEDYEAQLQNCHKRIDDIRSRNATCFDRLDEVERNQAMEEVHRQYAREKLKEFESK